jgi:hypothetical protein
MGRRRDNVVRRRNPRRGSTAIEFALVMMCVIPLFFGTMAMGFTIGRGVESVQVTRDVGHMYGEGLDFTTADAQQLTTQLASGFNLTATGNALLIFSQITTVFPADCTAASVSPCANSGLTVFKQRVTMGNTALKISAFGTPPATYIDALGNIAVQDYLTQPSVVATGFSNLLAQADGDVAYLVEGYFQMPDISFLTPGQSGSSGTGGMYARAIF